MFARNVSLRLKPNSVGEFTRILDEKVIPVLRKEKGFQDQISFVNHKGTEAVSITFWDQEGDAEAYSRGTYPGVLKGLANVLEGTPQVEGYEVSNSTFHKIAAQVAA